MWKRAGAGIVNIYGGAGGAMIDSRRNAECIIPLQVSQDQEYNCAWLSLCLAVLQAPLAWHIRHVEYVVH